ncbi:MAG: AAA family ATPase [Promethearchaeota archaeon]
MSKYKYIKELEVLIESTSQNKLAKDIGISPAALSRYMIADYNGNISNVNNKIEGFLSRAKERGNTWDDVIVDTSVKVNMLKTIRFVHNMRKMGIISGPAGIGKTISCVEYKKSNPGTILITGSMDSKSVKGIVSELYFATMGKELLIGTARIGRKAIINKLAGSDRIIIVDEAHKLVNDSFQELKYVHDQTGCPIMLVGTYSVYDRLEDRRYGRILEEVDDRIPVKRRFQMTASIKDIYKVANGYGIDDKNVIKKLAKYGKYVSLRKVVALIQIAKFLSHGNVSEIDIISAETITGE